MKKITESDSPYNNIEQMSTAEILEKMNAEDHLVPIAVEKVLPVLETFLDQALDRMKEGGRLFYIGAGTSGRLGILDASECPPTFGVEHGLVNGLIAGGDDAIRVAVERAEDDVNQGWQDLLKEEITAKDVLVGIAASGTTPYVVGAIKKAREHHLLTAGITCNPGSPLDEQAEHALVPLVGPEFITGSTRLKSGTAQKLLLNMISTRLMIGLGHVEGNKMVDMQLSNQKLVERGARMIADRCNISVNDARIYLKKYGSVRKAVIAFEKKL